jgi:hypothetical protein
MFGELADKAQDVDPKFDASTGHKHSGAAGDAPPVPWANVSGKPTTYPPSAHKSTHASGGADALTPADIGAVSKAGDTMTGNLTLSLDNPKIIFQDGLKATFMTEADAQLLDFGVNYSQAGIRDATKDGGLFRIDVRSGYPLFNVLYQPAGGSERVLFCVDKDGQIYQGNKTYKVWHAGNDGAGSGLDADLVKGRDIATDVERIKVALMKSLIYANAVRMNYQDIIVDSFVDTTGLSVIDGFTHDAAQQGMVASFAPVDYISDDASSFGYSIFGANQEAQIFHCDKPMLLTALQMRISRVGSPPNPLVLTLRRVDANGYPKGAVLASRSIAPADVSTSNSSYQSLILSTPIRVNANESLALVASTTGGDYYNCYKAQRLPGSSYSWGVEAASSDGGSTWTLSPTTRIGFVATGTQYLRQLRSVAIGLSTTRSQGYFTAAHSVSGSSPGNVVVTYDISLNGGATWLTNVSLDSLFTATSGNSLVVRINVELTGTVTGQNLIIHGYGVTL